MSFKVDILDDETIIERLLDGGTRSEGRRTLDAPPGFAHGRVYTVVTEHASVLARIVNGCRLRRVLNLDPHAPIATLRCLSDENGVFAAVGGA